MRCQWMPLLGLHSILLLLAAVGLNLLWFEHNFSTLNFALIGIKDLHVWGCALYTWNDISDEMYSCYVCNDEVTYSVKFRLELRVPILCFWHSFLHHLHKSFVLCSTLRELQTLKKEEFFLNLGVNMIKKSFDTQWYWATVKRYNKGFQDWFRWDSSAVHRVYSGLINEYRKWENDSTGWRFKLVKRNISLLNFTDMTSKLGRIKFKNREEAEKRFVVIFPSLILLAELSLTNISTNPST